MRAAVRAAYPAVRAGGGARALRVQQHSLAAQRVQVLRQRQQEDAAWQAACRERHAWLRPGHWTPGHWAA